ncbi:hypothetical protein psyc5s11_19110 [Clostridium gelidum]|uniref:Uncharacterized protein n=1 Tax=Clostridium gelidum TaxID=704125 RepID=A0ABN6IUW8_9CLOT|nr:hypothetical protein psyc5s11_19110 [Clostridium gelidum]
MLYSKKHCTKYMNLVQCLYMENYVSPGGTSETGRVEVATEARRAEFAINLDLNI